MLYHSTSLVNALSILRDGQITPREESMDGTGKAAICLTRNPRLNYEGGAIKFVISRTALGHNKKIVPFDYMNSMLTPAELAADYGDVHPGDSKEQEERVHAPIWIHPKLVTEIQVMRASVGDAQEAVTQLQAGLDDLGINIPIKVV